MATDTIVLEEAGVKRTVTPHELFCAKVGFSLLLLSAFFGFCLVLFGNCHINRDAHIVIQQQAFIDSIDMISEALGPKTLELMVLILTERRSDENVVVEFCRLANIRLNKTVMK